MKKFSALFLSLALFLSVTPALAQDNLQPEDLKTLRQAQEIEVNLNEDITRSAFPATEDKVSVEDGVISLTSRGITVQIAQPFGMVFLTQDMQAQIETYLKLKDGRALAEFMINNEINGIFFDLNLDKQIWLFVDETNISKMFINSDETFDVLMQTLKNMETDDLKFSEEEINGKRFVRVDQKEGDLHYALFYFFHEGKHIIVQIRDKEPLTPEMIESLKMTAESLSIKQ